MQGGRPWQARLREWQGLTISLAKQQVPAVYSWLGAQVDTFVQRQNLTEVAHLSLVPGHQFSVDGMPMSNILIELTSSLQQQALYMLRQQ